MILAPTFELIGIIVDDGEESFLHRLKKELEALEVRTR